MTPTQNEIAPIVTKTYYLLKQPKIESYIRTSGGYYVDNPVDALHLNAPLSPNWLLDELLKAGTIMWVKCIFTTQVIEI